MIPQDLRYTKEHEWIRLDGDQGTVGITDHAQEELGDITFVEMPETGQSFQAGDEAAMIESSKAASGIYAPLAGKVVAINEDIEDAPELVNEDPYGKGWLFRVELDDPAQAETLMDAATYEKFLQDNG